VNGQDQHLLDAFGAHQAGALFGRRQKPGCALRRHDAGGMRVEGQNRGLPAALACQFHNTLQDLAVSGVNAVGSCRW